MLTTGFDAPEVQNIVLARPVFEPTLYQQIKGRGTRLCPEINKENFVIFDFCGVAEFYEETYDWEAPRTVQPLSLVRPDDKIDETIIAEDPEEYGEKEKKTPQTGRLILDGVTDTPGQADTIEVGPDGDIVDRMMYQSEWEEKVKKEFADISIDDLMEDDELEEIVRTKIFDRPRMYFNETTLQQAFGVIGTVRDFVLHALGMKELPSTNDQIEDWKRGMIEKYGISLENPSQDRVNMVELLVKEIIENPDFRDQFDSGVTNYRFLQEHPFSIYPPQDWIETFGQDQIKLMIQEIQTDNITNIF
jgi:type I restriction enzyme R subunit